MSIIDDYRAYLRTERFLDSLNLAKPVPHFVAPRKTVTRAHPFGLERVRSFLAALGNPQRQNRYVHVAGTSGKTSTTYLVAALLQGQGYTTGRFISPHLATAAEYLTINDRLPAVAQFVEAVEAIKPVIDSEYEATEFGMISHAEVMVALACRFFSEQQVDIVAWEAFLGGRHDATNVIERAAVSILTNIGLDHTHLLGETREEIAAEKVGIMKTGCPFLTAEQRPEILAMFREEAATQQTTVEVLGHDFAIERLTSTATGSEFDYRSEARTLRALRLALVGPYQARNAALALRALDIVTTKNQRPFNEDRVRDTLGKTVIPGRFEQVQNDPVVILDAAHNAEKMASLTGALKQLYPQDEVIFVCALTSGRDPGEILRHMLEASRTFYLTRAIVGFREDEEPRYLQHVLKTAEPDARAHIALDPFRAVDLALREARTRQKVVCVTGSAYLVAYVRQRWHPEQTLLFEKND